LPAFIGDSLSLCNASTQLLSTLTEINTSDLGLRIRLRALPTAVEFDEFDLSHFRVGITYTVPLRLAWLLVLAGYAELVESHFERAEAADSGHPRKPKRRT
jgi:hypothetical protein